MKKIRLSFEHVIFHKKWRILETLLYIGNAWTVLRVIYIEIISQKKIEIMRRV